MTKTVGRVSDNSLRQDLYCLLAPLDPEVLKEFIHRCSDELCGRKGPSETKFCTSCSWTQNQFQYAVASVKKLLTDCMVHNYSRIKIEEILPLNEAQINGLMSCIAVRADELQKIILNSALNVSSEVLCDYDWKLKYVMGSSSLSSLQESLLELDITTMKNKNSVPTLCGTIKVELTHDNVSSLISALEKAQESLPNVGL